MTIEEMERLLEQLDKAIAVLVPARDHLAAARELSHEANGSANVDRASNAYESAFESYEDAKAELELAMHRNLPALLAVVKAAKELTRTVSDHGSHCVVSLASVETLRASLLPFAGRQG